MKKDDNLFDEKIRKKLKEEISFVPNNINEKIDEAISKGKKKRFSKKVASSICAASLAGIFLFGITMPAYAKNIPIIGSIFEKLQLKKYENYDKYASDLNLTKESNGITMTINKVVYDGIDLDVLFTLENLPENKFIDLSYDVKVNGKDVYLGGAQGGRHINGRKTFLGDLQFSVDTKSSVPKEVLEKVSYGGYVEIPDEFTLTLNIRSGNEGSKENVIMGQWSFDIPVSSEKVEGKVKEKDVNIDLGDICKNTYVNKIITTPINTVIQINSNDMNFSNFNFIVFDDKGRYIESKGGQGLGNIEKNGQYNYYTDITFKEIYEDTESLTFIPYEFIELEDDFNNESNSTEALKNRTIETELNLKGETKVKTKNGEDYSTITRINVEGNKTIVYFKSKYSTNALPFEIVDNNTGEKIKPINEVYPEEFLENITYLNDTKEYTVTFDKALNLSNNYSIKCHDYSKKTKVYENEKFSLDVPK